MSCVNYINLPLNNMVNKKQILVLQNPCRTSLEKRNQASNHLQLTFVCDYKISILSYLQYYICGVTWNSVERRERSYAQIHTQVKINVIIQKSFKTQFNYKTGKKNNIYFFTFHFLGLHFISICFVLAFMSCVKLVYQF